MDSRPPPRTDLTPVAERLLERHLAARQGMVPARVRAVVPRPGLRARRGVGRATRSPLDPAVRSSLFVNLLTEDNLPYYTSADLESLRDRRRLGHVGPALDRRGGPALDRAARLPHGDAHDRSRRAGTGAHGPGRVRARCRDPPTIEDSMVYVALQELATRIAHHNTGKVCSDPAGVRSDEADRERREPSLPLLPRPLRPPRSRCDPSAMVCAIERQVRTFEMPGTGIIDFERTRQAIARCRHLRLLGALRADPRAGRAPPLERRSARGSRRPRPKQRATRSSRASIASAPAGRRMANRRAENDALAISA